MPEMTFREAIRKGLTEAMDGDQKVFLMGEDIGAYGGSYAVTAGFLEKYGPIRVRDTPISESAIVGTGVGAAMGGLRPIVEIMTINFSLLAMDQIVNHAVKVRSMSAGAAHVPMVMRTVTGGGAGLAATHSQSLEGWYATVPGMKVVIPSTPADALGLLRTALQDEDPVLFCEHALLYGTRGEVPAKPYTIPFGKARIARQGKDVTLVGNARMVHVALQAADELAQRGVQAEVIDLRTLRPLDVETVATSVKKTHRCLIIDEAWKTGAIGTYLAFRVQQEAFDTLDAPIAHIGGEDVPMPYARNLEQLAIPSVQTVLKALKDQIGV
ncbi:MAG: alpha-ketoacid dehydrogenase subunit beta [Dehalococcoidia bacterium]|nr:alpha-ketoacid dehydrogenase subunit beta [Dehalococcoidia bacterium]